MSDCSDTFAGFDPISDDEYDITMYLLQDRCQEQIENISNYSSSDEQAESPQSGTVLRVAEAILPTHTSHPGALSDDTEELLSSGSEWEQNGKR